MKLWREWLVPILWSVASGLAVASLWALCLMALS